MNLTAANDNNGTTTTIIEPIFVNRYITIAINMAVKRAKRVNPQN